MRRMTVALAAAVLGLSACGSDSDPVEPTTPAQIANPASVFCEEQGGMVEIVDEADGQVGYCNLPDGRRIEEWEYFRSQQSATTNQP